LITVTADVSRVPPEASSAQRMLDIPSSTAEQNESLQSALISPEYVRDATLCMIRKNEGYNIPAMSKYLENSFPLIPTGWRMPIVVAIFTAVQKASAVHGDRAYSSSRRWWKDTVGTPIISTLGTWSLCRRAEEATK